jgi:small subunit ribosomal protein S14
MPPRKAEFPYGGRKGWNVVKICVAKGEEVGIFPAPMAKTCWLEREKRKQTTVNKYAKLRAELKANKDYVGLTMLPRDASPTRLKNRCRVSGRRRAFLRRFQMSRLTFREMANAGLIPGVTKSSW